MFHKMLLHPLALPALLLGAGVLWWAINSLRHSGYPQQVGDGDGFTLERRIFPDLRVRIAWIDAPEFAQAAGVEARNALRQLVRGKRLRIRCVDKDRYGRRVSQVWAGRTDVGLALIEQGLAWNYPGRSPGQSWWSAHCYASAQRKAKKRRLGLWAAKSPEPPWEYRHRPGWRRVAGG